MHTAINKGNNNKNNNKNSNDNSNNNSDGYNFNSNDKEGGKVQDDRDNEDDIDEVGGEDSLKNRKNTKKLFLRKYNGGNEKVEKLRFISLNTFFDC